MDKSVDMKLDAIAEDVPYTYELKVDPITGAELDRRAEEISLRRQLGETDAMLRQRMVEAMKGGGFTNQYVSDPHIFTSDSVFGRAFSEIEDRILVIEGKVPEWPRKKMRDHVNEAFISFKHDIDNTLIEERRKMTEWVRAEMEEQKVEMRARMEEVKTKLWEEFSNQ